MNKSLFKLKAQALDVAKLFLLFLWVLCGMAVAQVHPNSGANAQATTASTKDKSAATSPASSQKEPLGPRCPTRMAAGTQKGQHTVILTWNANPPSNIASMDTVGYCLYRRTTPHIPKKISDCNDCEQLNTVPIKGTGCIDDAVSDNATYRYVVTAINKNSEMSEVSNEATPVKKPIPPGTFPSCRESDLK